MIHGPFFRILSQVIVTCGLISVAWRQGWANWTGVIDWVRELYLRTISEPIHGFLATIANYFWPDFPIPPIVADFLVLYLLVGSFCVSIVEGDSHADEPGQAADSRNILKIAWSRKFKWWHPLVALFSPLVVALMVVLTPVFGMLMIPEESSQEGQSGLLTLVRNTFAIAMLIFMTLGGLVLAVVVEGWLFGMVVLYHVVSTAVS